MSSYCIWLSPESLTSQKTRISQTHFKFFPTLVKADTRGRSFTHDSHGCRCHVEPDDSFVFIISFGCIVDKTVCPGEVTTVMNAFLSEAISKHDEVKAKFMKVMFLADGCNWKLLFQPCWVGGKCVDVHVCLNTLVCGIACLCVPAVAIVIV